MAYSIKNAGRISPPGKHYGLYIASPQHTDKLEFDEFPVIASQFAFLAWQSLG